MEKAEVCPHCKYSKLIVHDSDTKITCQLEQGRECPYHLEHTVVGNKDKRLYIYNIGYGTCEESADWQYMHEEKFTDEQLFDIMEDCLFIALKNTRKPNSEYEHSQHPSFQDLMSSWKDDGIFHKELKKRGFQHIEFTGGFDIFGWAKSDVPDDWDGHTGPETKKLQKNLKRRLEEQDAAEQKSL